MNNRDKIISSLEEGPVSFSDLKDKTNLTNGVIQHHVNSSSRITKNRGAIMLGDQCSDCDMKSICETKCIYTKLQSSRKKEITRLYHEGLSQAEIAEELDISRATVNYHMQDLRESKIVQEEEVQSAVEGLL